MYTLQSGQIENALRTGGANDASAKQMVQQLANCQQLLEHRGDVELTKPVINYFPTILPANNSTSFPFIYKDINVQVPPFQMQEWKPIPFVPMPPWENIPYPPWPGYGWNGAFPSADGAAPGGRATTGQNGQTSLSVPGGATLGPTVIRDLTAGPIRASDLDVSGNARIGRNLHVGGDVRIDGDLSVGGDINVQGTATFNGPVNMSGPVVVGGVPLTPVTVTVVSRVFWDATAKKLKATSNTLRVFGMLQRSTTTDIISGTECP